MRRLLLDVVIGWNQGAAIRHERSAERARRWEDWGREQYRRRYLTRWTAA